MKPIDRDIGLGAPISNHHLRHAEEHANPVLGLTPFLEREHIALSGLDTQGAAPGDQHHPKHGA